MPDSFVVLWSLERCRWLERVHDHGPLEVVFGGPHISLPSLDAIKISDTVYPICVQSGVLHIIARMTISDVLEPDEYVKSRLGFDRPPARMWDGLFQDLKKTHPGFGHRLPTTCCDKAAAGIDGTELRFDRAIPNRFLPSLTFGPKPGREKPLKGVGDAGLKNVFAFQGHVRRLSASTSDIFAAHV